MLFSSTIFLFCFLPLVLLLYYIAPKRLKNTVLLISSLFFYAWGELFYVAVMIVSILTNYITGLSIRKSWKCTKTKKWPRLLLITGIIVNIGLLFSFKYANFVVENINVLLSLFDIRTVQMKPIHLPLGISFFTFQATSYIIDVYRKETPYQKNILNLALYISLFPQLIAGPIVRYHDVAKQISKRKESKKDFSEGVCRFVIGLSKKVLLANTLALVADKSFEMPMGELSVSMAWLGALAYTFQIFFDFSGYSDMAIGLGKMFGFHFLENFNYPYISKSITEFWRRWHISLGTWFRDYLYFPLGGSRCNNKFRLMFNLAVVWLLTGIWHGANWTFICWGFLYLVLIVFEKVCDLKSKGKHPVLLHIYTMFFVIVGWVLFRSESIQQAVGYLKTMFGLNTKVWFDDIAYGCLLEYKFFFICALIFSLPLFKGWKIASSRNVFNYITYIIWIVGLFLVSISYIVKGMYNPFIYFNF